MMGGKKKKKRWEATCLLKFYFYCCLLRKHMDNPNVEYEFLKFHNKIANQNDIFNKVSY